MDAKLSLWKLHADPRVCQSVKEAARFIDENPGTKGQCIADAIHISFDHFRKSVVPVLKQYGYRNYHNGNGYYPPPDIRALVNPTVIPHGSHRQSGPYADI